MSKLSLCMIVKNEEQTLKRCLNSVIGLFDEIIIVDTGSNDKTKQVAKEFTTKIYDFKWCDDFSNARNYAFSKASCEYIMWLDADDVIPTNSLKKLLNLKKNLTSDVYMLKYNTGFINNSPTFSYYRERIIKNCSNAVWHGAVHECITPFGKVKKLDIPINHQKQPSNISFRNLKIYESTLKSRTLSPREQYYYGRELFEHNQYQKCINVLMQFVNSNLGWAENVIDALYILSICYKNLNDNDNSLNALFKTFKYDSPRANICCKIGDHFFENKKYIMAEYWYKTATKCKDVSKNGGFVESIYYNYYPYLQLCCTNYNLRKIKKAEKYNNLADKYLSTKITQKNKEFFKNLTKNVQILAKN